MRANKAKDTKPELTVRKLLHRIGYRFRLHRADLPGTPDIVFPTRRKVIEIRGCFWHSHSCDKGKPPKTNSAYWIPKLAGNVARDEKNRVALNAGGWRLLEIWQCELTDIEALEKRLIVFLESQTHP